MKKITLLICTLSFAFLNAQQPSQWEERERSEESKKPHYSTWAIGVDIGNSFSMMDMYSAEANDHSLWSDYGNFGDIGASLKIEKLHEILFMCFDRYETHIQAFLLFINGKLINFQPSSSQNII